MDRFEAIHRAHKKIPPVSVSLANIETMMAAYLGVKKTAGPDEPGATGGESSRGAQAAAMHEFMASAPQRAAPVLMDPEEFFGDGN